MCLAVNADGLLPGTFSLLWHYLRVETGMRHWVVPLELAEIKNKTATPPPPPPRGGAQRGGFVGFSPPPPFFFFCHPLFFANKFF